MFIISAFCKTFSKIIVTLDYVHYRKLVVLVIIDRCVAGRFLCTRAPRLMSFHLLSRHVNAINQTSERPSFPVSFGNQINMIFIANPIIVLFIIFIYVISRWAHRAVLDEFPRRPRKPPEKSSNKHVLSP